MTEPLEWYIEHAEERAQRVLDHWAAAFDASKGNPALPAAFQDLVDRPHRYRDAQAQEGSPNALRLERLRQDFAKAYKALDDSVTTPRPTREQSILDIWKVMKNR